MKHSLYILSLVLFLTACSSLRERADKRFNAGEYRAAMELYERAVAKDPNDGQAKEGLTKSRQRDLEERLIQVRQQRMSDNLQNALDRLADLFADEARWNVAPSGAAFATQTEETEELFKYFTRQVQSELEADHDLKARIYLVRYEPIFRAGALSHKEQQLARQVGTRGLAHCQQLKASAKGGAYAQDFVKRYCMTWGDQSSAAESSIAGTRAPSFGRIEFSGAIQNLPPELLSIFSEALLGGLKSTPYYSADGGGLNVQLTGQFNSAYQETPFIAIHQYKVQVPYQEIETVPYQEMVTVPYQSVEPYTETRTEYDPLTQTTRPVTQTSRREVTAYRQELQTRYRQESRTHYRTEERTLPYAATRYQLSYLLNGKAKFDLDGVAHELPLIDELQMNDTFHSAENPEIGLVAKPKKVPTVTEWVSERLRRGGPVLSERVSSAWDSKYCQVPANMLEKTQVETVMKCVSGTKITHEFVDNWFQARFGMTFAQVNSALGAVQNKF